MIAETERPWVVLDPAEGYSYGLFDNFLRALRGDATWVFENSRHNLFLDWHHALQRKNLLHPSVEYLLRGGFQPVNYKQLALEFPHVAESDETRLAYTRNLKDGANDRQLITSIGKYLSRHFPDVADHLRRDAAAYHTIDRRIIVNFTPDIIRTVEIGPRSCMASIHGSIPWRETHTERMGKWYRDETLPEPDWTQHPYWCYDPALGWSMAQRWSQQGEEMRLDGRALVYRKPGSVDKPVFVRTYARNKSDPVNGWSETDFALHTWLEKQGHVKVERWPFGAQIRTRKHEYNDEYFAPYVDGTHGAAVVNDDGTLLTFVDPSTGEYPVFQEMRNTHGYASRVYYKSPDDEYNDGDDDDYFYCEHCDEHTHNDNGYWAGRHEDLHICDSCRDDHYTYVIGRGSNGRDIEYLVHYDSAIEIADTGEHIDLNNPPANAVCLYNYTWEYRDQCVCIDNRWYRADDDEHVVCLTSGLHKGEWVLTEDAVLTEDTGEWIRSEDAYEVDDVYYEHKPEEVTTTDVLTSPILVDPDHTEEEEIHE